MKRTKNKIIDKKTDKLNVLHLRDSPWVCGPGRTVLETADNIDVDMVNYFIGSFAKDPENEAPLIVEGRKRNLQTLPIYMNHKFDRNVVNQMIDYVQMYDIHIIHSHELLSDILAIIVSRKTGITIFTTQHGWIANNISGKIKVFINKMLLHFFDHIIVVSNKMKRQLKPFLISDRKLSVLHNAINFDKFTINKSDNSFRNLYNLNKDDILIANIGRLSPEKGQKDFISAATTLLLSNPKIKVVLVGIGPDEKVLRALVDKLGISDRVIFTGFITDMLSVYNTVNLIVQSSYTEGMPNVILESLAMQVPVIATDVGGTSEIIMHKRSGILISPGDVNMLEHFLFDFFENQSSYVSMAKSGRKHVFEKFCILERTKRLTELYKKFVF